MEKILVIGSLNMDQVTKVDITPKVGETVAGIGLELIPGGKGANQAVAMGKLGADVSMVGLIGKDANGDIIKDNLEKMNVNNTLVKSIHKIPTGIALIMVNKSGDNSIVVIPGANGELKVEDVKSSWFEDTRYVVCQLETPLKAIEASLKMAKSLGVKTILNPAPAKVLSKELLSNVDLLIPNEIEFETLTGVKIKSVQDMKKGFRRLESLGIKELIVTLGAKGAWFYNGIEFIEVCGRKVEAVDTTAAGDSFIGGFVTQLARGKSIKECLEYATKVASITVTRFGAQSSLPSYNEVNIGF